MAPAALVELSTDIPTSTPTERIAEPAILLISELRNEVKALFMENELVFPLARYMPEASIVMAIFPRSSILIVFSSSCKVASFGEETINWMPGLFNVCESFTPQMKSTERPVPCPSFTVVLTFSVAVMFRVGLNGSPLNSM